MYLQGGLIIFHKSQFRHDFLQIIPASCLFLGKVRFLTSGGGDGGLNYFSSIFNSGAFHFSVLPCKRVAIAFPPILCREFYGSLSYFKVKRRFASCRGTSITEPEPQDVIAGSEQEQGIH